MRGLIVRRVALMMATAIAVSALLFFAVTQLLGSPAAMMLGQDPAANLEEMVEAFDPLVRAGKLLYIGITDMPFWQFATAYFHAERNGLARFASVQNHYNLLWR